MTGQDFIKKITPIGCAAFLFLTVAVIAVCFLSGQKPISGYEPPHTSEYYAQNEETLQELKTELEENVFPYMDGISGCEISGDVLEITIEDGYFAMTRGKILKYFDLSLFEFKEG